jgi:hypothetical protein
MPAINMKVSQEHTPGMVVLFFNFPSGIKLLFNLLGILILQIDTNAELILVDPLSLNR